MMIHHQKTAQEIFEELEYRSNNYILIHFNAFITNTPNGITIKCNDEEDWWYHQLVGKSIDITELKSVLIDTDWSEYFKDKEEGLYEFKLLLSIDIGTTAIKAGCFSIDGKMIASAYLEYPLIKTKRWQVEQDANLWWKLAVRVIKEVLSKIDSNINEIIAMSISAQGISYVPVDDLGRPLLNAFSWLDTRAVEQADRMKNLFTSQSEAFHHLGLHIVPTYTLPKIMWLKDNESEIFEKTHKFSTCLDFINNKLIGEFITDYSIAGGTLAHNIQHLCWAEDVLKQVEVPLSKLPLIDWAGTPIGVIKPEVACELGLPKGVQLVLGGHDQECAALGAGLRKREVSISMGTASILVAPVDQPIFDSALRIPCYPHIEKGQFVLEAVVSAAGISFRWLRDFFNMIMVDHDASRYDYEGIIELAKNSPPGANGVKFFPHLSGATSPFWNPNASGVFYDLSLATNPADIARSLLEGWCYQLKTNLMVIEELTSCPENVIMFGGGTRSKFIQKLLADIIGFPILVSSTSETALLGAAMLAGYGAGIYSDMEDAKGMVRKKVDECSNDHKISKTYHGLFEHYREIEELLIFNV